MGSLLRYVAYVYTLFIAVICLMPAPQVSAAPKHSDKLIHAVAYLLFCLLWFGYFYIVKLKTEKFNQALLKSCVLAVVYGIVIEVLQAVLTDSRSADFNDFLANCLGVFLAFTVIYSLKSQLKRLKSKF